MMKAGIQAHREALAANKLELVAAHRRGDWEAARRLSLEKMELKRRRYCQHPGCGVRLSGARGKNAPKPMACVAHSRRGGVKRLRKAS